MRCIELSGKEGAYRLIILCNYTKLERISHTKIMPDIGIEFNY